MILEMAKDITQIIKEKIKQFRLEAKLTQEDLGLRVGYKADSAKKMISAYESGGRSPGKKTLERIAAALNKSAHDFVSEENIEPANMPMRLAPLISWIRAGQLHAPIDNLQPGESEGTPQATNCKDPACFALRVKGDSMEPEFKEGEIIIVSPVTEANPGDYVVAKYNGEVTLKKYQRYPDAVVLRPLNEKYNEIVIKGKALKNFKVVGKVVEKTKRY